MWLMGIVATGFAGGLWWLFRWFRKWKDPSWDSVEGQSKAFLWSKKGTGAL